MVIQNIVDTILAEDIDMSGDYTSNPQGIEGVTCYAIQFSWTGFNDDTDAVLSTEASNDLEIWSVVDSFIPSDNTNNTMLNVEKAGYKYVRIKYVQVAGAGTLKAIISGKAI